MGISLLFIAFYAIFDMHSTPLYVLEAWMLLLNVIMQEMHVLELCVLSTHSHPYSHRSCTLYFTGTFIRYILCQLKMT